MERLQVKGNKIINTSEKQVWLRGTCVGGWMNMENFINGYPGDESGTRWTMAQVLGHAKAEFFFDRLLDYFFNEEDIRFIKECGATVVRLPVNYRHFEDDAAPFRYLEKGFTRLDKVIRWCTKHNLYVIIDLHAVQGWQNPDWHCDNPSRQTLFWTQKQFQDRFVALWEELARHYANNPTVAGYNVMNEPVTNAPYGRFGNIYHSNWESINNIYRRVVTAIRAIDPATIIFLEGDYFSTLFSGLDKPIAENLAYSSHNYTASGFGPGKYPGTYQDVYWDRNKQEEIFLKQEGTRYARSNNVPLWVGEFGSVFNGLAKEKQDRLQALDDQLEIFGQQQVHWTTWTYKDVGVMGWVTLPPETEYMRTIWPSLQAKYDLYSDFWMHWLPRTPVANDVEKLADKIEQAVVGFHIDRSANRRYLMQHTLSGYVGNFLQPHFAQCFKGMTENDIDRVLQSFAFNNCTPNKELVNVLKKHLNK
jgi:aryl-phospho-beta-D-glucosidase BglC (GH1 family)